MIRCKRCVMPNTRPDTAWVDGVCSACIAYEKRDKVDWYARRNMLEVVLARGRQHAKERGLAFDCIVPSSGGKDSHYQVLTLLEHGARPLVVTAGTCHLTPIGRRNIDNLARYATTIEYTPNRRVRAKLNRIGLREVGDISWPEHVAIFTIPFRLALATGIPLLFYGENPQNQYGAPTTDAQEAMQLTMRWRSEFGGFLGMRPADLVGVDGLSVGDLGDYALPPAAELERAGIEAHFLGQYIAWDSHRNAEVARQAGMEQQVPAHANAWHHENLDNAQTGIHDFGMYRKFGYGRGCAQVSVDIRAGELEREQALEWVSVADGRFPYTYAGITFGDLCAGIDQHPAQVIECLDRFTNWDLFERTGPGLQGVRPKDWP